MADAKENAAGSYARPMAPRPLSPHLSIFRFYINMTMSVMHRVTGVGNYYGSMLLAAWLVSAAVSDEWFNTMSWVLASPLGLIVLFGFTWSAMHHLLGGIRHFIWDTIHGFELPYVRALSWLTLLGSLTLTGLIWIAAFALWSGSPWGKLI